MSENEISFEIAGRKIPFIRSESKPSGDYVFFPITKDGLHVSVHPSGKTHLKNRAGYLAELDLEALKQTTVEDFQTLFRYPNYSRDLFVFPIPSSFGAWFGDMFDIPGFFSKMFPKTIYVMRACRLPEFFRAKPETYIIIDPKGNNKVMMQFKGNPLGPLNFDVNKGPANPRMKNMFSINLGIQKALSKLPDSQFKDIEPDELTVSQMGAQVKAIFDQIQIIRWNKGGRERPLGTMVNYLRARRLTLA